MPTNFLAIVVVSIISMVLGALWYSPVLFGNQWMQLMGFTKKDLDKSKQKGMAKSYIIHFIALLVTAYVLSMILSYTGYSSFGAGAKIGFLVWLGFIATTSINSILWENKPFKLYAINISHHLVSLLIMGGILAIWN